MEYKVLRYMKAVDLEKEVVNMLQDGWETIGGVSHSGESFIQAVIKKPPVASEKTKGGGETTTVVTKPRGRPRKST